MSDENVPDPSQQAAPQEVDRIRDIIFGHQMRDYDQRFQTFERDLDRVQKALDHLTEQLADQDSTLGKKLQTLRRDMRQADDALRDELRETAQQVTADKVDRATLGELFIELGNHLKTGGSLVDLLKGLEKTEKG
jgi:predicted  nucleic acid-binding Zn-ribbon protein